MGADVLIIEEAAYVDLRLFYEVVMPLLEMTRSVMIMISTPVNTFNYFSKLLELKDGDGNPVFLSYSVDLVCKRCRESEHPERCRHMVHMLPRWKSEDKMKIAELIMRDQMTTLLRESRGLVIDDASSYFAREEIEALTRSTPWSPRPDEYPRWMIVSIDPNTRSGKGNSDMALFAMTLDRGMFTVSQGEKRGARDILDARGGEVIVHRIAGPLQEPTAPFVQRTHPVDVRFLVHHLEG